MGKVRFRNDYHSADAKGAELVESDLDNRRLSLQRGIFHCFGHIFLSYFRVLGLQSRNSKQQVSSQRLATCLPPSPPAASSRACLPISEHRLHSRGRAVIVHASSALTSGGAYSSKVDCYLSKIVTVCQ